MIQIVTGLPGSGKSYYLAELQVELLYRNRKWYEAEVRRYDKHPDHFEHFPKRRILQSNLKLNSDVEAEFGYGTDESFLQYWEDPEEIARMRDCDLIWEEMGAHVDARGWESLPLELRRFLQQHRHRGVEIYGNVQEFSDIDVAVRRLTENLIYLVKIVGSRDPSPTSPPVTFIWGIVAKLRMDPRQYKEDMKFAKSSWGWDGFMFLRKSVIKLYDMHNDIRPGKYPALQHRERKCNDCGFVKTFHV